MSGVTEKVRAAVWTRSLFCCERCGRHTPSGEGGIHHRRPRGMGGTRNPVINRVSNLMWLCGSGTTGCHGWVESHRAEAVESGWIVQGNRNPADVSVSVWDVGLGRAVMRRATDDGGWVEVS